MAGTEQVLITFQLGGQTYALPIEPVVQIVEMVSVTTIPNVKQTVEGVINYHGTIIPVINLGRQLGLGDVSLGLETHLVILLSGPRTVGLMVDRVLQVLSLPGNQIVSAGELLPESLGQVPVLAGVARTTEGTLLVLDPDHLFTPRQEEIMDDAVQALVKTAESTSQPPVLEEAQV